MVNRTNMNEFLDEMIKPLFKQKENIILEQLGDLVSKGFLVIEQTEPILVQSPTTPENRFPKITLSQKINLVLKDKEYIAKLEKENSELKEWMKKIKELFNLDPMNLTK